MSSFSIGFDDLAHSELPQALKISRIIKTKSESKVVTKDDSQSITELMHHFDEPFFDTSALPMSIVSALAKQSVKVVLSGDGGDELFRGYSWYDNYELIIKKPKLPGYKYFQYLAKKSLLLKNSFLDRSIKYILRNYFLKGFELYSVLLGGAYSFEKASFRKRYNIPKNYDDYWFFNKHLKKDLPLHQSLRYLDFKTYLVCDILQKVDMMSMRHSIECRVPLLSTKIIEFAFKLPKEKLVGSYGNKQIMKSLLAKSIPISIIKSKKKGFSIPQRSWKKIVKIGSNYLIDDVLKWEQKA